MTPHPDRCAEWRELASCELDSELSELGAARLERHISSCPECAAWRDTIGRLAELLRASEAETVALPTGVPALRRRLSGSRGLAAAGASAVAAAAVAALAVGLSAGGGNGSAGNASPFMARVSIPNTPVSGSSDHSDRSILLTPYGQAFVVWQPSANPDALRES